MLRQRDDFAGGGGDLHHSMGIECDEKTYGLALTNLHGAGGSVDERLAAE